MSDSFSETVVIGVGGSSFTDQFGLDRTAATKLCMQFYEKAFYFNIRIGMLIGGGTPARQNQDVVRKLIKNPADEQLDWAGILATQANASYFLDRLQYLKEEAVHNQVITNPSDYPASLKKQFIVGAGFEPGCSTDFRLMQMAEALGAKKIVNLTNVDYVYTADPKKDEDAKPLSKLTWEQLVKIQGDGKWQPGSHMIFDPVATKRAIELGLTVASISYKENESLSDFLIGKQPRVGSVIHP